MPSIVPPDCWAELERNVFVVDATSAVSRQAWFNGKPCASDPKSGAEQTSPPTDACTWDLADSFTHAIVANNIYHNATGTTLSDSFPGSCESTPLGACTAHGKRSAYVHGCACASLAQWRAAGEDHGSLTVDPELHGPLRVVSAPAALALGIEPLYALAKVGPDWALPSELP